MTSSQDPPIKPPLGKRQSESSAVEPAPSKAGLPGPWSRNFRDTVEAIVGAFVLAFLFRTCQAEVYVIPTGSMAPTLQGRHKEVHCAQCGYQYRASASAEVDDDLPRGQQQNRRRDGDNDVIATTCPMCRYEMSVDPRLPSSQTSAVYNGDHILVAKFVYDISQPRRWDIVVFRYPGDAKINYIKRLVGLPGEAIRIFHGDIYTTREGDSQFQIERKPPDKLRAMMQIVYDNDYTADALTSAGWPVRWQPVLTSTASGESAWKTQDGSRSFESAGKSAAPNWLRYHHFIPNQYDWQTIESGQTSKGLDPHPLLITDFYAYNACGLRSRHNYMPEAQASLGLHWVGDLMLECEAKVESASGEIWLDLVEGGQHFRAIVDVATGQARLEIDGLAGFRPTAATRIKGSGTYRLAFSNADDELLLWVNGKLVQFDAPTAYPKLNNESPRAGEQDPGDLAPAGIASNGAAMRIDHIKLWRDIYYIAADVAHGSGYLTDYGRSPINLDELADYFSTPSEWEMPGNLFEQRRAANFSLKADQFFMLGDNSPASKDSRLWEEGSYVDRELLIGKALFQMFNTEVHFPYWPHFRQIGFVR